MTEEHLCVVMELAEGDLHSYIQVLHLQSKRGLVEWSPCDENKVFILSLVQEKRHLPESQARWLFQQVPLSSHAQPA